MKVSNDKMNGRRKMRTRTKVLIGVLVGLVAIFVIAGVTAPAPEPQPMAPAPAAPAAPERDPRADFLAGVRAIDPALVENPDRAVRAGENVCLDVDGGKEPATVERNTAERFGVDTATAARIVDVARGTVCA